MRASKPREWVKAYLPLLSLCEPGFYWLFVKDHFPTDGSGRFFWSEIPPDNPQDLLAFKWGAESEDPAFLLPTQQTSSFREANWELARQTHETHPGVALFLSGYGSALLDGHHRATAAAVAGKSFPCVTFKSETVFWRKTEMSCPTSFMGLSDAEETPRRRKRRRTARFPVECTARTALLASFSPPSEKQPSIPVCTGGTARRIADADD